MKGSINSHRLLVAASVVGRRVAGVTVDASASDPSPSPVNPVRR